MSLDRVLTTNRLTLRPLNVADANDLFRVFGDVETMRYWPALPHANAEETARIIAGMNGHKGACWWVISVREQQAAIGCIGYLGGSAVPGMGYILRSDLWGRGYTTEAVRAAMEYGFRSLGFDRVELWIEPGNLASRRVAQKVGCTARGQLQMKFAHRKTTHTTLVYGLSAREWFPESVATPDTRRVYALQPVLPVRNVLETAAFYRDKLGFIVEFLYGNPPTHGGVFRGEWTTQGARIQLTQHDGAEIPRAGWLYIFVTTDIDELYEEFRARGVHIVHEIETYAWNMREFTIEDCNRHRLRFGTPI
jgi:ribosomal-protein-alanine N-acetyltransferase